MKVDSPICRSTQVFHGDALALMAEIPSRSVNLVLSDPPFGTAGNQTYDKRPPLNQLWQRLRHVLVEDGVAVLFSQGMFTAELMVSAPRDLPFRYALVWEKNEIRGFLNAKKMPLRKHEDILVFYGKQPTYNPQKTIGHKPMNAAYRQPSKSAAYGTCNATIPSDAGTTERYPVSVLKFDVINHHAPERIHPFQKPVPLLEWVIKTYTNPGQIVMDPYMGSGSTGVACLNTGRRFIGIEVCPNYFAGASARLAGLTP